MDIDEIFKKHWFIAIAIILNIAIIILFLFGFLLKNPDNRMPGINCNKNTKYLTDIMLNGNVPKNCNSDSDCPTNFTCQNNSCVSPNNFYCIDGYDLINTDINIQSTNTSNQLCYKLPPNICDSDYVVTDVLINNFSSTPKPTPVSQRCPTGYNAVNSFYNPNPNQSEAGFIKCPTSSVSPTSALCVKKDNIKNVTNYIGVDDILFSPNTNCPQGYILTNNNALTCGTQNFYLCKKNSINK